MDRIVVGYVGLTVAICIVEVWKRRKEKICAQRDETMTANKKEKCQPKIFVDANISDCSSDFGMESLNL
jgi:hypothetical protein